jgi:hypothetical protein
MVGSMRDSSVLVDWGVRNDKRQLFIAGKWWDFVNVSAVDIFGSLSTLSYVG